MKKTNITRTITSLLVAAAMLGVTSCGQSDNTSSAAPKATTTAASETTEMGTVTSRSATTTSISATSSTSASSSVTSSAQGSAASTTTKSGTTTKTSGGKTGGQPASNGGTVNNGGQSYSGNTTNNGNGNYNYQPAETQAPQTEHQTERQTERQTTTTRQTTTAKKTQAPKPKPTTTTTAKPKVNLTQSDIDRLQKELQEYSNKIARPRVEKIYAENGYSSVDDFLNDISSITIDNSTWFSPQIVYPTDNYKDVLSNCKAEVNFAYNDWLDYEVSQVVILCDTSTDYNGNFCYEIYFAV